MFVKYCGFTREEDVKFAATCGIQAVGFIFYPPSKRYVTPEKAAALGKVLKATSIKKVGVFVGSEISEIKEIVQVAELDMVQLYDVELFDKVNQFVPVVRAYRIKNKEDMEKVSDCPDGNFILLDSFHPDKAGGTGHTFDWSYLKGFPYLSKTLIAGGINLGNISTLLNNLNPYGIDLSSGIEDSPGKKSREKMQLLIQKIRQK